MRTLMMRVLSLAMIALGVAGVSWWQFGGQRDVDLGRGQSAEIRDGTIRHFVSNGDTLDDLANRYDLDLNFLLTLTRGEGLLAGQVLTLKPGPEFWCGSGSAKFKGMAPPSKGVDFPLGSPEGGGYYNAQGFGENHHLGEDWNGNRGGNTDLGDPVKSVAHGVVFEAKSAGEGWGNVVRVLHNVGNAEAPSYVESLYGHLDSIDVGVGQVLKRGQRLGTIGTANGRYIAHLHLEMRDILDLPIGPGYAAETTGYLKPTDFINSHRPNTP